MRGPAPPFRARSFFVRAWKRTTSPPPETLAGYGRSLVLQGGKEAEGVEALEAAQEIMPSSFAIHAWLVEAYAAAKRFDEAVTLARALTVWSRGEQRRRQAEDFLSRVEAARDAASAESS